MDGNDPDSWMIPYEKWRNITNNPLSNLRPRTLPPISAFIPGNPYEPKRVEKSKIMEIA